MQKYRIHAIIDVTSFDELDAQKEFYDLIADNSHLGFVKGFVLNVGELTEEDEECIINLVIQLQKHTNK